MKTKEVIELFESNGGLDFVYIERQSRQMNCSLKSYFKRYVMDVSCCSSYVANKVCEYYNIY